MTVAPIRRALIVDATPETAFEVFTADFGGWWPLGEYGVFGDGSSVAITDGEIVEASPSGETANWGKITAWDPPQLVAFTWHPSRDAAARSSQVEVRFTDLDGQTLVVLEHSGWEVFDDPQAARAGYSHGWPEVLAGYGAAVNGEQVFVALQHRPGPAADPDLPIFGQPGFAEHVAFLSRMQERGLILAAGPLPDSEGEGMTVLRLPAAAGLAEATRLATEDDRSVASGFLNVDVRPWQVMMRG
jgi:uncharacterized protein YndB with AHSA1/START domain/uncharacterized protein YciI